MPASRAPPHRTPAAPTARTATPSAAHATTPHLPAARSSATLATTPPLPAARSSAALALLAALLVACGPPPAPNTAPRVDPVATLARIAAEPEGDTRRLLVTTLRRVPAAELHPLLTAGFASPDPTHRVAAALVAGRRADGKVFAPELIAAAADPLPTVRVAAARGMASMRLADGFPALVANLSHETASVRLSALRALARIDPDRAAALPEVARLQLDPDSSVSGAATKVARKTLR